MRSHRNTAREFAGRPGVGPAFLLACLLLPAAVRARGPALPSFSVSSGTALLSVPASTAAPVAGGGNFSVPLPDGRTLWLLNNVWTGKERPDGQPEVWGIIDGAAALSPSTSPYSQAGRLSFVSDENGWPLPLLSVDLKEYSQARKFWPRSGLCSCGRCCAFYSIMNNFGPDPYDYFRVGQGLACSESPAGPYVKARAGDGYAFWNDIEPAFGSAALSDDDGWVYVYGREAASPGGHSAQLARVRPDKLTSRTDYSYYSTDSGSAPWTSDVSEASDVIPDMPEEFSVSYNPALGAYLAVYSDLETGSLTARLAPYPWGPWGAPSSLLACSREDYCYGGREQSGFAADGGKKIFVTLEKKHVPYLYEIDFD